MLMRCVYRILIFGSFAASFRLYSLVRIRRMPILQSSTSLSYFERRTFVASLLSTAVVVPFCASAATSTCPPTLLPRLTSPSGSTGLTIVGVAHISEKSAENVEEVMRKRKPGVVFLELDEKRVGKILSQQPSGDDGVSDGVGPSQSDPQPKPRASSSRLGFTASLLRGGIQKMYSTLDSSGFSSGEEFVVAVNEGNKLNSKIVLGDRDVDVTLERVGKAVKKDFRSLLTVDSKKDSLMSALIADNTDPSGGEVNLNALVESMLLPNNVVKLTEEVSELSVFIV